MSNRNWYQRTFGWVPRPVRQVIVLVIGGTLLLLVPLGAILPIVPGWIFLPLALAILAAEFAWAARWLLKIRRAAKDVQERAVNGWSSVEKGPFPAVYLLRCRSAIVAVFSRQRERIRARRGPGGNRKSRPSQKSNSRRAPRSQPPCPSSH